MAALDKSAMCDFKSTPVSLTLREMLTMIFMLEQRTQDEI